jgi:hypothetical protein
VSGFAVDFPLIRPNGHLLSVGEKRKIGLFALSKSAVYVRKRVFQQPVKPEQGPTGTAAILAFHLPPFFTSVLCKTAQIFGEPAPVKARHPVLLSY